MACENYHLSRRHFMHAFGAMGAATFLGMPLRDLYAATGAAATAGGTARLGTAEHVILLWMSGGMSHLDTFDPKPGREVAGEFGAIPTRADGIAVSEVLPKLAQQMQHAALVRSLYGPEGDHDRARYNLLTGYRQAPQLVHPSVGSVVAHERTQVGDLPSFVSIGGRALSAGYMGQQCEAYFIGNPGEPDPYVKLPEGITAVRAQHRLDLLRQMNQSYGKQHPDPYIEATNDSYRAAVNFMNSPALAAFKLEEESAATRSAYGATNFGRGCLLARRLVEQGVRFVQVSLGGFDTHDNNFEQMRRLGGMLDQPAAALIADLASSGLLSKTLVVVLSEFGRTPKINRDGGRDHHPGVFSALLAGGGIRGGQVIGSSDADAMTPRDRPVSVPDLHATICHALAIDPTKHVDTPLKRPMKLVDGGRAIGELL